MRFLRSRRSCVKTFKREISSILTTLQGSPWASLAVVQSVLNEYGHLAGAGWTWNAKRRTSLQIFHACRAIDTLLAQIAEHESSKPTTVTGKPYWTLGSSLRYIQNNTIGGSRFIPATKSDIDSLTTDRNSYLHRADLFPTDLQLQIFLTRTARALQEAVNFPM